MSFVFRAPKETAPHTQLQHELQSISEHEYERTSGAMPQRLRSKSPVKGLTDLANLSLSHEQSTLQQLSQLQLGKEELGKSIQKSRVGSVFKSYREWEPQLDRSQSSVALMPGPGHYSLVDPWEKKVHDAQSCTKNVQSKAMKNKQQTAPSVSDIDVPKGYYLCSLESQRMRQEKQKVCKQNHHSTISNSQSAKGIDFNLMSSKRIAFPINALTSLVGYPTLEQKLDYKCKNSYIFPTSTKRRMDSQSEKILRNVFCGNSSSPSDTLESDELVEKGPGPCTYNPTQPTKDTLVCKGASVPFLTGAARPQFVNNLNSHLSPGYYFPPSQHTVHNTPTHLCSFASKVEREPFKVTSNVPSVGKYSVAGTLNAPGVGALELTKNQGRVWYDDKQNSPGPARYANDPDSLVFKNKYAYQPQSIFRSNVTREIFSKSLLQQKPGPGTYETNNTVTEPELPESLQPKKTPFLSQSPRFQPLQRLPILIEDQLPKAQRVHKHKSPRKVASTKPFNHCSTRFEKQHQQVIPPVGTYYSQQNDFRGWQTKTFSKLFSRELQ